MEYYTNIKIMKYVWAYMEISPRNIKEKGNFITASRIWSQLYKILEVCGIKITGYFEE